MPDGAFALWALAPVKGQAFAGWRGSVRSVSRSVAPRTLKFGLHAQNRLCNFGQVPNIRNQQGLSGMNAL